MFLHQFVRRRRHRRRRRPHGLVHTITSEQPFRFLSFWQDWWTWPINCLVRFLSIFVVILTLNFQRQIWNSLYLGQKWSDCRETKSKHMTLTLNFQGHICNLLYLFPKWLDCYKMKSTHIYWTHWRPQWPPSPLHCDLDLEFSRLNMEFAISQPKKWFDCHKMKSTHIDWTEGLNDHQVWPWPWPWKERCKDLPYSDQGDFRCLQCSTSTGPLEDDEASVHVPG